MASVECDQALFNTMRSALVAKLLRASVLEAAWHTHMPQVVRDHALRILRVLVTMLVCTSGSTTAIRLHANEATHMPQVVRDHALRILRVLVTMLVCTSGSTTAIRLHANEANASKLGSDADLMFPVCRRSVATFGTGRAGACGERT